MRRLTDVLNARPKDRVIATPGVYDMVSLRMAAAMGFEALYMTGYGTVASHLGLPDAGLASYADMVGRVEAMARMAETPLIADGDTGYGGLLNVRHAVRGYERAGAAAIQLEDQEFPKKCGHTPDRRVIAADEMVRKIAVALSARVQGEHSMSRVRGSIYENRQRPGTWLAELRVDLATGDVGGLPEDADYVLNFAVAKTNDWEADLAANSGGLRREPRRSKERNATKTLLRAQIS